ncbi:tetratricopeptide repeat protein [bacterium]|nr:tetratricopeptide repeat protein [bacterium]
MYRIFLILFVIVFITTITGCCGPSGKSKDIGKKFFINIIRKKYDASYKLIAKDDELNISLEEFSFFFRDLRNVLKFISVKSSSEREVDDRKLNEKFKQVKSVCLKMTGITSVELSSSTGLMKLELNFFVVEEKGEWKVLFSSVFDFNNYYSTILLSNAILYSSGDKKDLKKALEFCDKALKMNPNNDVVYSTYMMIYMDKKKYTQAYKYGKKHYDKLTSSQKYFERHRFPGNTIRENIYKCKVQRSNLLVMLSTIQIKKGHKKKAKNFIKLALKLNPLNQKAKEFYYTYLRK